MSTCLSVDVKNGQYMKPINEETIRQKACMKSAFKLEAHILLHGSRECEHVLLYESQDRVLEVPECAFISRSVNCCMENEEKVEILYSVTLKKKYIYWLLGK